MAARDFYEVLGVKRDAGADEIKKAFRRLSRKHHPDTGGTEEKFKELNEAYQVLSAPEKRAQYDQYGRYFGGEGPPGAGGAPPGWPGGGYSPVDMGDLGDLFGNVFSGFGGGGARQSAARRGSDLTYELSLDFDEALAGVSTKVDVQRSERCATCKGGGAKPGTSATSCPACGGTGHIQTGGGMFAFSRPCPRCGGSGRVIESPCSACKGKGAVLRMKPVTVNVPAGVTDGGKLRFKGKGEPGAAGGPAGDLYVVTRIRKHPFYTRDGADVLMDLPVTLTEAALGTEITIPAPDGTKVKLKIAEGTQDGKLHRISGKGAPKLKGSGRGDLKVKARVTVPTDLDAEQKELLRRFESSRGEDVRAHIK
ncbi:MAG: molecular chaperone DnaJ [Coriobacteriaceae bacterium]|nr:molecular chaperone DnaJ [Coriobacteriaceae bacterium]